jgi:predicted  nucleic acid-binding Zn-ribbon protein
METDELRNYSDTLRQIEKEMKAFLDVKKGLKGLKKRIEKVKEDKFKISGEINKLNTTPGDTIKISLFKKVPKAARIEELSGQVSKLEKEDANLHIVMKIAWNVIHDNEFPKLIVRFIF